ncbi:hypothetical protein [Klebsiella grimontii]|uniref:Lipoprotein n=1 Tax=Klebsiella grimontii TaxID=2058152 RepID=A0A285AX36_9ENTR|nr:hypothetical protein [Klebsiella grimontii]SNU33250.1 conserved exported hypothetical protein [Klebsiella grimontii]
MKKLSSTIIFLSGFLFATSSFANETYDLKCTLDDGDQMMVSHVSDTVYIAFLAPGDDPDEGGSVIKLDVSSGGVKQELTEPGMKYPYFTLTGTDEEIDGKIIVDYNTDENSKISASFAQIDSKGNNIAKNYCKPDTIKARNGLTEKGIIAVKNSADTASTNVSSKDLFKLSVSQKYRDYSSVRVYFWKYQLISNVDDLKIQKITVNRGHCLINEKKITYTTRVQDQNTLNRIVNGRKAKQITEDNEVPRTSWDLNYSDVYYFTVTTDSDYGRCRPQEVVIETNKGSSSFTWDI